MSQDSIKEQRKRDKFFSFAQSTAYGLTKEINRYYSQTNSNTRSIPGSPQSNTPPSLSRANTDEIDEIISTSIPEITHPQCIIFPTYGCKIIEEKEVKWKVVLAGWTFAKPGSSRLDRWLLAAGRTYGGLSRNSVEDNHFSSLLNQFRCQTMRMASIQLTLPGVIAEKIIQNNETHAHHELNAEQKEKIRDYAASVTSNYNGRFEEEVVLDHHAIEELRSQSKYLSVQANFDDNDTTFDGSIDLIGEYGVSVISDIDDTIKVTDILDGKDAILQNTFFKPGREVPQMNGVYQAWAAEGAHVHYVSNSPWQVYPALSEFIIKKGFPRGSMHLRNVSTQELIIGKPGKHKIETVSNILCDFPNRKFILVGDSGEIDPEIYSQIYHEFPGQVIKIFIHDVSSKRALVADQRAQDEPDSYYSYLKKFLSRENALYRKSSSSQFAMEAMTSTEMPEEEQDPVLSKFQQYEARMERIRDSLPEGVFTVFTQGADLLRDPLVAEELLRSKTWEQEMI